MYYGIFGGTFLYYSDVFYPIHFEVREFIGTSSISVIGFPISSKVVKNLSSGMKGNYLSQVSPRIKAIFEAVSGQTVVGRFSYE